MAKITEVLLPAGFTPGPFDVVCARGAKVKQHVGNLLFRKKIEETIQKYADATSKLSKSLVVSAVVDYFRERSSGGGFVKEKEGAWYSVDENLAREKVGQAIRERLSNLYRSSTKAKRQRWREEEATKAALFSSSTSRTRKQKVAKVVKSNTINSLSPSQHNLIINYDEIVSINHEIMNRMHLLDNILQQQRGGASKIGDQELLHIFTENNIGLLQLFKIDDKIRMIHNAALERKEQTPPHQ